jgi:hypothetical protein
MDARAEANPERAADVSSLAARPQQAYARAHRRQVADTLWLRSAQPHTLTGAGRLAAASTGACAAQIMLLFQNKDLLA